MAKNLIDKTDYKILTFLMSNARKSYLEIAREFGISGAAIHQRIKKLEDAKVITGSRININQKLLGYNVCAFLGVKISDPSKQNLVKEAMKEIPEVVAAYFITGKYNLFIKVFCADNDHFMHMLFNKILKIDGISYTETFMILDTVFERDINTETPLTELTEENNLSEQGL
ncbi:MAG: Lrp/AsnC ligand binding domain-containing protein [Rikenellaceae bacterium]|nr:Lrp/AsnC ligand binding domain-containing protein [Rikenellaceae bacterium]